MMIRRILSFPAGYQPSLSCSSACLHTLRGYHSRETQSATPQVSNTATDALSRPPRTRVEGEISLLDFHHREAVGAQNKRDRVAMIPRVAASAAREESAAAAALMAVRNAGTGAELMSLVVTQAKNVGPALYREAAESLLRLNVARALGAGAEEAGGAALGGAARIMKHLGAEAGVEGPQSRWQVTPEEMDDFARYVARTVALTGGGVPGLPATATIPQTGADTAVVRGLLLSMAKRGWQPDAAMLADFALCDISWVTALHIVSTYERALPTAPLPAVLAQRVLSLAGPSSWSHALGMYARAVLDPTRPPEDFTAATHAHALKACAVALQRTRRGDLIPAADQRRVWSAALTIFERAASVPVRGEEGVGLVAAATALLSDLGCWSAALRVMNAAAFAAEDTASLGLAEDEEGDSPSSPSASSASSSSVAEKESAVVQSSALVVHSATSLAAGLIAAVRARSSAHVAVLTARFRAFGYSFAALPTDQIVSLCGSVRDTGFAAVTIQWATHLIDDIAGAAPGLPGASRGAQLAALSLLAGVGERHRTLSISGADEPRAGAWTGALALYAAAMAQPLDGSPSLPVRVAGLDRALSALFVAAASLQAPEAAITAAANAIVSEYGPDSVEAALVSLARLRAGAVAAYQSTSARGRHAVGVAEPEAVSDRGGRLRWAEAITLLEHVSTRAPTQPMQMLDACRAARVVIAADVCAVAGAGGCRWDRAAQLMSTHPTLRNSAALPDPLHIKEIAVVAAHGRAGLSATAIANRPLAERVVLCCALLPPNAIQTLPGPQRAAVVAYLAHVFTCPESEALELLDAQRHRLRLKAIEAETDDDDDDDDVGDASEHSDNTNEDNP